ncbi:MAG: SusC/RagA family TonB-linked outer membrane protein [Citrobacter freundii]|nr:MAG: SusC/RagA family TonB-linked outer membrane protein [Citrobacter freundii]
MNKHTYKYLVAASLLFSTVSRAQEATDTTGDTTIIGKSKIALTPGRFYSVPSTYSTGAVSTVKGEELYQTVTPNLTNTLYGRLAGLTVLQNFGEPGNDDASLGIRGNGSYGYSAFGSFKIFVDGFEVNQNYFRYLSPSEIESVSILKDAAALATFGMRGANGVIWVETKRGKAGKSTVQVQARTAVQKPINLYKPLNSYDFARLYNQAISNDNKNVWSPVYTDAQLQDYRNGNGTNIDWYDQVVKSNGAYSDADVVFKGGNENARYAVIMNYANQQGLYNVAKTDTTSNQFFKKYNLRTNLDFNMFTIFEARVDLGARIEEQRMPNYGSPVTVFTNRSANQSSVPIWRALESYPSNIYPVLDQTGNWSGSTLYPNNPVATIHDLGWRNYKTRILQGNFELKEKLDGIAKGLYAKQSFSFNSYSLSDYSKTANYARYLNGVKSTNDQPSPTTANNLGARQQEDWKQLTATIGYDRVVGDHSINTAVNYYRSDFRGDGFYVNAVHFDNLSGRASYTYKNKYVGELGFSWFGYDGFAKNNRREVYPALSAAWIISNEDFLQNNSTVNYLKLRGSAGRVGYADSDEGSVLSGQNARYLYQQYYTLNTAFYTGDAQSNGQNGLNPLYIANADIHAERSMKYNLGVDLQLFSKLSITLDAFLDKRSEIITRDNTIPGSYGNISYTRNLGKQTNRGIEATATYSGKSGKLGYSFTAMMSYNKNRIDYMAEVAPLYAYSARTGKAVGTPIGLEATGFYDITDFNPDGTLKAGQPLPAFGAVQAGDIKYKDVDGNGFVDNNDRVAIGKPEYPQLTYAASINLDYAGFDLRVLLQGISGASVNILGSQAQAFVNNGNAFPIATHAWAYYPDQNIDTRSTATYPRLTTLANDNNYRASSFWIKDRDYLRVRNIELGYSFGERLLQRAHLSKLRVFVSATNPVTWSKLLRDYDIDPESQFGYPALKSFNAGFSITF